MAEFYRADIAAELQDGEKRTVTISGRQILVARIGGSYYAVENRCPHMGGKLDQGKLEGIIITCPLHGSRFDITTGKVVRWTNFAGFSLKLIKLLKSPRSLTTFKVKIEGNDIFIEI